MIRILFGKHLITVALALGIAVGCSTAPKEEATAPVDTGVADATQAINSAKAAMAKAESLEWIWRDTGKFLGQAEDALAKGDTDTAIKLANKARNQADLAVNQYYLEHAKVLHAEAAGSQGLSAEQSATLASAGAAINNAQGRKAYDMLGPLVTELRAASIQYEVIGGDSLWSIAGKDETYSDPYQWPLIYKANRDKISDADVIHPGQVFSVNRNPSSAEVNAAVDHARNRGAWSMGVTEDSDQNYLGGTLDLQ